MKPDVLPRSNLLSWGLMVFVTVLMGLIHLSEITPFARPFTWAFMLLGGSYFTYKILKEWF